MQCHTHDFVLVQCGYSSDEYREEFPEGHNVTNLNHLNIINTRNARSQLNSGSMIALVIQGHVSVIPGTEYVLGLQTYLRVTCTNKLKVLPIARN